MKILEVKLLPYSPTEDEILSSIYVAARGCYSDKSAFEICAENASFEKKLALFQRLWKDRHRTTLTHANFTFSFNNIPIKIATQLTRAQVGVTFDQRSTRYLPKWTQTFRSYDYGVQPIHLRGPGIFTEDQLERLNKLICECYDKCSESYEILREYGVSAEDASYVLNLGAYTGLTATFNLVSFKHWIQTRLYGSTGKPQSEHTELACVALEEFKIHYPNIAKEIFGEEN